MDMRKFKKLLLTELRMVIAPREEITLSDKGLAKAVTLNENLKSLGYTLSAKDIVAMAALNIDGFFAEFEGLIDDVLAKPMYPDFPSQVMEMDEAVFRFHQIVHYFTTYGLQAITGEKIHKGWLPDVKSTEKTKEDVSLLDSKVLEAISEDDRFRIPFKRILSKNERMTLKEKEIIKECVKHFDELDLFEVPFKENLKDLFITVMDSDLSREEKVKILSNVCQHTGDVWKCLDAYLPCHRWHLKTAEKKTVVALLESFPISDFKANLIITNEKAERVKTLLEFLSYNRYSRKPEYKQAVSDLRNDGLRSWQSLMNEMIESHDPKTLEYMSKRPGMLLRSINRLLNRGFDREEIEAELLVCAEKLSKQTLVSVANAFSCSDREHAEAISGIVKSALYENMLSADVPFKNKKVFIDWQDIDPDHSFIGKSDEGGYVREGLAIKFPEECRYLRFFVYWDDEDELDMDLHARAETVSGESFHVGWNADFDRMGIVHSGDITHSDAAEYIDIDIEEPLKKVDLEIDSYSNVPFKSVDTCYTGIMAVSELGIETDTKLYDPKNVLWSHNLRSDLKRMRYGHLDLESKVLRLGSQNSDFSLSEYMDMYIRAANATLVDREDADIVLVPYKAEAENEVSILDRNFFQDQ